MVSTVILPVPPYVFRKPLEVRAEIARLVVVALVVVELVAVKFWRVVEPRARRLSV